MRRELKDKVINYSSSDTNYKWKLELIDYPAGHPNMVSCVLVDLGANKPGNIPYTFLDKKGVKELHKWLGEWLKEESKVK